MRKWPLATLALWLALGLVGCEPDPPKPAAKIEPHPQMLVHPDKQLEVFDAEIVRSSTIDLQGDMRPNWIVSGRIENQTDYFVDEAWIELHFREKATEKEVDSTVVKLQNLRLPPNGGVKGFSQMIKMLPSSVPWSWDYEVIYGLTEPQYEIIRQ